jgi:hypothetical protein
MKIASTLLASALLAGAAGYALAQSGANPTPPGAQPDKTISAATHCLDKATNQPRLKTATTGAGKAAGGPGAANPTAGDKSAKATGTTSQSPGQGKAAAMNLPPC